MKATVPVLGLDLDALVHHVHGNELPSRSLPVRHGHRCAPNSTNRNEPPQLLENRALALKKIDEHPQLSHFTGYLASEQGHEVRKRQRSAPRHPLVGESAEEHVGHKTEDEFARQGQHRRVRSVPQNGEARILRVAGVEQGRLVLFILFPVAVVRVLAQWPRRWAELFFGHRRQLQRDGDNQRQDLRKELRGLRILPQQHLKTLETANLVLVVLPYRTLELVCVAGGAP
mmetsp:Transcript_54360/g.123759  ORF Transcript_54360/g.123759 Transcript_54360/m.123759 type:complete len:229 (-) Transcript_54360:147-833(-)